MTVQEFEKQWLAHFACGIDQRKIQKYVVATGNYIWHIFSWQLLPAGSYLVGDAARRAFDALSRRERERAIYIDAFDEEEAFSLPWQEATAAYLERYTEVYALSHTFSWTYIKTHEGDHCGPYFYRKAEQKEESHDY